MMKDGKISAAHARDRLSKLKKLRQRRRSQKEREKAQAAKVPGLGAPAGAAAGGAGAARPAQAGSAARPAAAAPSIVAPTDVYVRRPWAVRRPAHTLFVQLPTRLEPSPSCPEGLLEDPRLMWRLSLWDRQNRMSDDVAAPLRHPRGGGPRIFRFELPTLSRCRPRVVAAPTEIRGWFFSPSGGPTNTAVSGCMEAERGMACAATRAAPLRLSLRVEVLVADRPLALSTEYLTIHEDLSGGADEVEEDGAVAPGQHSAVRPMRVSRFDSLLYKTTKGGAEEEHLLQAGFSATLARTRHPLPYLATPHVPSLPVSNTDLLFPGRSDMYISVSHLFEAFVPPAKTAHFTLLAALSRGNGELIIGPQVLGSARVDEEGSWFGDWRRMVKLSLPDEVHRFDPSGGNSSSHVHLLFYFLCHPRPDGSGTSRGAAASEDKATPAADRRASQLPVVSAFAYLLLHRAPGLFIPDGKQVLQIYPGSPPFLPCDAIKGALFSSSPTLRAVGADCVPQKFITDKVVSGYAHDPEANKTSRTPPHLQLLEPVDSETLGEVVYVPGTSRPLSGYSSYGTGARDHRAAVERYTVSLDGSLGSGSSPRRAPASKSPGSPESVPYTRSGRVGGLVAGLATPAGMARARRTLGGLDPDESSPVGPAVESRLPDALALEVFYVGNRALQHPPLHHYVSGIRSSDDSPQDPLTAVLESRGTLLAKAPRREVFQARRRILSTMARQFRAVDSLVQSHAAHHGGVAEMSAEEALAVSSLVKMSCDFMAHVTQDSLANTLLASLVDEDVWDLLPPRLAFRMLSRMRQHSVVPSPTEVPRSVAWTQVWSATVASAARHVIKKGTVFGIACEADVYLITGGGDSVDEELDVDGRGDGSVMTRSPLGVLAAHADAATVSLGAAWAALSKQLAAIVTSGVARNTRAATAKSMRRVASSRGRLRSATGDSSVVHSPAGSASDDASDVVSPSRTERDTESSVAAPTPFSLTVDELQQAASIVEDQARLLHCATRLFPSGLAFFSPEVMADKLRQLFDAVYFPPLVHAGTSAETVDLYGLAAVAAAADGSAVVDPLERDGLSVPAWPLGEPVLTCLAHIITKDTSGDITTTPGAVPDDVARQAEYVVQIELLPVAVKAAITGLYRLVSELDLSTDADSDMSELGAEPGSTSASFRSPLDDSAVLGASVLPGLTALLAAITGDFLPQLESSSREGPSQEALMCLPMLPALLDALLAVNNRPALGSLQAMLAHHTAMLCRLCTDSRVLARHLTENVELRDRQALVLGGIKAWHAHAHGLVLLRSGASADVADDAAAAARVSYVVASVQALGADSEVAAGADPRKPSPALFAPGGGKRGCESIPRAQSFHEEMACFHGVITECLQSCSGTGSLSQRASNRRGGSGSVTPAHERRSSSLVTDRRKLEAMRGHASAAVSTTAFWRTVFSEGLSLLSKASTYETLGVRGCDRGDGDDDGSFDTPSAHRSMDNERRRRSLLSPHSRAASAEECKLWNWVLLSIQAQLDQYAFTRARGIDSDDALPDTASMCADLLFAFSVRKDHATDYSVADQVGELEDGEVDPHSVAADQSWIQLMCSCLARVCDIEDAVSRHRHLSSSAAGASDFLLHMMEDSATVHEFAQMVPPPATDIERTVLQSFFMWILQSLHTPSPQARPPPPLGIETPEEAAVRKARERLERRATWRNARAITLILSFIRAFEAQLRHIIANRAVEAEELVAKCTHLRERLLRFRHYVSVLRINARRETLTDDPRELLSGLYNDEPMDQAKAGSSEAALSSADSNSTPEALRALMANACAIDARFAPAIADALVRVMGGESVGDLRGAEPEAAPAIRRVSSARRSSVLLEQQWEAEARRAAGASNGDGDGDEDDEDEDDQDLMAGGIEDGLAVAHTLAYRAAVCRELWAAGREWRNAADTRESAFGDSEGRLGLEESLERVDVVEKHFLEAILVAKLAQEWDLAKQMCDGLRSVYDRAVKLHAEVDLVHEAEERAADSDSNNSTTSGTSTTSEQRRVAAEKRAKFVYDGRYRALRIVREKIRSDMATTPHLAPLYYAVHFSGSSFPLIERGSWFIYRLEDSTHGGELIAGLQKRYPFARVVDTRHPVVVGDGDLPGERDDTASVASGRELRSSAPITVRLPVDTSAGSDVRVDHIYVYPALLRSSGEVSKAPPPTTLAGGAGRGRSRADTLAQHKYPGSMFLIWVPRTDPVTEDEADFSKFVKLGADGGKARRKHADTSGAAGDEVEVEAIGDKPLSRFNHSGVGPALAPEYKIKTLDLPELLTDASQSPVVQLELYIDHVAIAAKNSTAAAGFVDGGGASDLPPAVVVGVHLPWITRRCVVTRTRMAGEPLVDACVEWLQWMRDMLTNRIRWMYYATLFSDTDDLGSAAISEEPVEEVDVDLSEYGVGGSTTDPGVFGVGTPVSVGGPEGFPRRPTRARNRKYGMGMGGGELGASYLALARLAENRGRTATGSDNDMISEGRNRAASLTERRNPYERWRTVEPSPSMKSLHLFTSNDNPVPFPEVAPKADQKAESATTQMDLTELQADGNGNGNGTAAGTRRPRLESGGVDLGDLAAMETPGRPGDRLEGSGGFGDASGLGVFGGGVTDVSAAAPESRMLFHMLEDEQEFEVVVPYGAARVLYCMLEEVLNPQLTYTAGIRTCKQLLHDYRELDTAWRKRRRTELKKQYIRDCKEARETGGPQPEVPDYDRIVGYQPHWSVVRVERGVAGVMNLVQEALSLHSQLLDMDEAEQRERESEEPDTWHFDVDADDAEEEAETERMHREARLVALMNGIQEGFEVV